MDRAMDRARTPHGYLVTLLLLCTTVGLAPTAARAQQQQPRPDDGGFAAHFHAQDTTVLVIEDPLPHLRALLTSDRLRRAVRTGAIGRLIGADAGRVVDAAEGWDWLERNQRWVPKQVAVGLSPDGFGDVDHLFRAIALVELLEGAAAGDGNDPKLR